MMSAAWGDVPAIVAAAWWESALEDLAIAVIGGVIATALWTYVEARRRRDHLHRAFDWLKGTYSVTGKREPAPRASESISITVIGSVLRIDYSMAEGPAVGQIVMDERLPTSGRGLYWHHKNGEILWGFWDIQTRRDESSILVHTTFAKAETKTLIAEGFTWKKIGAAAAL